MRAKKCERSLTDPHLKIQEALQKEKDSLMGRRMEQQPGRGGEVRRAALWKAVRMGILEGHEHQSPKKVFKEGFKRV